MRFILPIAVAIVLLTVNARAETKTFPPRPLSKQEQKIVESAVIDVLRDPDSAKFRHSPYNGIPWYCGYVNARNAYGGYTGAERFRVEVELNSRGEITEASDPTIYQDTDDLTATMIMVCEASTK